MVFVHGVQNGGTSFHGGHLRLNLRGIQKHVNVRVAELFDHTLWIRSQHLASCRDRKELCQTDAQKTCPPVHNVMNQRGFNPEK